MSRKAASRGRTSGAGNGDLGDDRAIPRRDVLQGMVVAAATTLAAPLLGADVSATERLPGGTGAQDLPDYYPPALTGLRGSHAGSFESAHALRDGAVWSGAIESGGSCDLIVVGAGISGLSAAHFFRTQGPSGGRVLILENHDDFGGHAKRNEFEQAGLELINGGTLEIDSPRPYSPVAAGLIEELGIDVPALARRIERRRFYQDVGLRTGVFFDRETFGTDHLAVGLGSAPVRELLAGSPLSPSARADVERIEEGAVDYLPEASADEKKLALSKMSFRDFLRDLAQVDPAAIAFYQTHTHDEWGVGIDAVSALDCWAFGLPGFKGMKLTRGSIARMGYTPAGYLDTGGSPVLHFPDGNATIARLLVRRLIPDAVPGSSVEDVITARTDYSRLDRDDAPVRLRLNSTVVAARNLDAHTVEVVYLRDGKATRVRAGACVLACWNMMIPYLCPELPETQKAALHALVKTPLVYSSVALRNWQAFHRLGVHAIRAPGSYHTSLRLNAKVDIGNYRSPVTPDQPVLLRMVRTPCRPGLPEHEQNKAGRAELLRTPFATFERNIREQLARMLGPGGFDPAHDIEAITVNRWPHGYAPEYNPLWDPELPPEQRANVVGRARHGRISIANSDSGAAAYTDSAIDQAQRAVRELLES